MVCCMRLHLILSARTLGMLVKSAHKNWKKVKDKFCAEKFDAFLKLCKNEGNVDVRNMLSEYRKKSYIKQNSAVTCNQVCGALRSSGKNIKETRWQFSWKDPSFRGENSQFFIHKLCAFLDYSNHKQFFLLAAFASIISAHPLETSWLRPCD